MLLETKRNLFQRIVDSVTGINYTRIVNNEREVGRMATMAIVPKLQKQPEIEDRGVDLAKSTVSLLVSFGLPGNSKKLKGSQFEVEADKTWVKAHKILLDSKELKEIGRKIGQLRVYLDTYCLPFPSRAIKLVPLPKVVEADEACMEFEEWFLNEGVPKFLKAYPRLCEQAELRLDKIYNPTDYPDVEQMKRKFSFIYRFISMGVPEQLRELKKSIYRNEKDKAKKIAVAAVDEIAMVRRAMLLKLVEHLKEKLSDEKDGKPKIFRDTTVTKLQEFLNEWEVYNVANDEEGTELVRRARALVGDTDPEALRTTDVTKEKVLKGLEVISEKLGELVVDKPTRKFRLVKS